MSGTITAKGQIIIPAKFRRALGLKAGDCVAFELAEQQLVLTKIGLFNKDWHETSSPILSEWESPEDEEDYRDL